jgi:hypothetical protein
MSSARFHDRAWSRVESRTPATVARLLASLVASFVATCVAVVSPLACLPGRAEAAPEAHIMRIDPRASLTEGAPVLTTVIELMQNKSVSEVLGPCAALTGDAELDCTSDAMEKPMSTWSPIEFPENAALFTVNVDGTDMPVKFLSKKRWGESLKEDGVGTAFLVLIDAAATMGPRFDEAKAVAQSFVNVMGPNDIVDVMFFNDRSVVSNSHWLADKAGATSAIASIDKTYPTQGRNRALFAIIKNAATDGFKELGNAGSKVKVPMHQALVILSNGQAGADAGSQGPVADQLKQYLNNGRFPEDNQSLPKAPVPVISVWFPSKQMDEFAVASRQFMQELANPEIGGFFSVVRDGQAEHGSRIASAVRARFDKMWLVKWQVACIQPTVTQTFKLNFVHTDLPIAGDAFLNVPVGIDPTTWPLDIDVDKTVAYAEKNPVYPGGSVRIYGNFCWGGKKERAELYMVPKNQPVPDSLQGGSLEDARNAQKALIEAGMHGSASSTNDQYVEFDVPNKTKFLSGKDNNYTARLIVYDNGAKRTSAVTKDKILTLKASEAPPPYFLIGGIAFGGVVLILLLVSIFRGGGKRRGSTPAAPPRPIVAGGGMPAPAPMAAPIAAAPAPSYVQRATLSGSQGIFTILPHTEMKAGRDGAVCQILLTEPRVSGSHATLKLENGQLMVRDDNSNNGTMINGQRIPPGVWSTVGQGANLRFGPVEFTVSLE